VANKIKAFLIILSMFLSFTLSNSAFASAAYGILMVVKGEVVIQQKDKVTPAKVGLKVQPGDTVITKKDARAKLVMVDKNIINISPDSKFVMEKYEYNPEENKKGALLNVIYGKVRTTVNQKYDGEQNKFQVKTKSSVAGVRGTDFLVSYNDVTNTSKVVTFEGKVEVGAGLDTTGRIINPVYVQPGEFTVAATGTPPTAPMAMSPSEMNTLKEQTVADNPSTDRPSADGDKPEKDKKDKERLPSNQPKDPNAPSDSKDPKDPKDPKDGKDPKQDPRTAKEPGQPNQPRDPASTPMGPPPPPASVMDQMGEDVSAPVVSSPPIMPPPMMPPNTQPMAGTQPVVAPLDPTLLQGKANVLINIHPGP
jgi:hypothetical protein